MDTWQDKILFEYEDATEYYTWQPGVVALACDAGAIEVSGEGGGHFSRMLPACEIRRYDMVVRKDINFSKYFEGVWYGDSSGCLFLVLPIMAIDALIARRTKFPVLKLSWGSPQNEEAIYLRSRYRGRRGKEATDTLAQRVMDFLDENGFDGPDPKIIDK